MLKIVRKESRSANFYIRKMAASKKLNDSEKLNYPYYKEASRGIDVNERDYGNWCLLTFD